MIAARPSRTALRVALRRAAHQMYDRPVVFQDTLALAILGKEYRSELQRTPLRADRPYSVALRAFIVARSRLAEDFLATGVGRGVTQYVLLGAGLDTFAYRNPFPGLRVFEVDHPDSQAWKQELIDRSGINCARTPAFVPVDFEHDSLQERLASAGFDLQSKTVFGWLGVVPYLTMEAFRSTLRSIAAMPRGSGLVMDYGLPRDRLPPLEQLAHDSLASRVRLAGEPFQLFMTPEQLRDELSFFTEIEDLGSTEINALYFQGRTDQLSTRGAAARMLRAWL